MTNNKRLLKVFLCHAREDASPVYSLYERLSHDGVDVWLDRKKLVPGQDWEREIHKAVHDSDIVIVCHSKLFNQRGFRQKEVKLALDVAESLPEDKIFIIPARLEECEVLEGLRRWNWVDLFENLPIATAENGYEDLLRSLRLRAHEVGAILRVKRNRQSKISSSRLKNERLVPDNVLRNWLIRHGIVANPFGRTDLKCYPFYPEGVARPDQWRLIFDPVPLFAHCPTPEDAQALAHILLKECLPSVDDTSLLRLERRIFPIWVWLRRTTPVQSPLLALAHSAVRTWLDILPTEPNALLTLPRIEQNALLELLCWSMGSKKALINLVRLNGLPENESTLILIRKIAEFESDFSVTVVPHDAILFSWLKIRPFGMDETYLILPGDDLFPITPKWWFEEFSSLISDLHLNGIVTKMFASSSLSTSLSLQEIELSWSEGWLSRSLENQFDAAMHSEERKIMGRLTLFQELFGPGTTEKDTTAKLISASRKSLARMLALGNRLLQTHCSTKESDTYLYLDELEDILKKHE